MSNNALIRIDAIKNLIHTIRGLQVMLDKDLAILYGVEVKRLNEQVKRNIERFPDFFCFYIDDREIQVSDGGQLEVANRDFKLGWQAKKNSCIHGTRCCHALGSFTE